MKHTPPIESDDHIRLLSLAAQLNVTKDTIENLLWALNAPPDLTSFFRIIRNLRDAMRLAEIEFPDDPLIHDIPEWTSTLDNILDHTDLLLEEIGSHLSDYGSSQENHSRTSHPLRGKGMVRHPLYTSMWNIHESNNEQDLYRLLQMHVFIAHQKLMRDKTSLEQYKTYEQELPILGSLNSSVGAACRHLRDLSLSAHMDEFDEPAEVMDSSNSLNNETSAPIPHGVESFYTYFVTKHNAQKSDEQTICVKHLGLFFKRVYFEQETESRKGGGKRHGGPRTLHDGFVERFSDKLKITTSFGDDTDPDQDWGEQHVIRPFIPQEEWEGMDLDPYENDTGEVTCSP